MMNRQNKGKLMAAKNTKERPILFSGPMVRAILEGRKTQTRRICKNVSGGNRVKIPGGLVMNVLDDRIGRYSPYGDVGDRLYVKETFSPHESFGDIAYRADGDEFLDSDEHVWVPKWKPSIFMPRWASRITLEIISIRVERLQDISEEDAKAEGAEPYNAMLDIGTKGTPRIDAGPYQKGYALLWGEINGPGSWAANPWVWVVEFKQVK